MSSQEERLEILKMVRDGVISAEDAVSWGLTGPMLRATGVNYDVRKAEPYSGYERFDFEVPLGTHGDNYDRFLCRFNEIEQSARIIEQALETIPAGPIKIDDPHYVLPEKHRVYGSIEGLMNHFKLIMHGVPVPAGEFYCSTEAAHGELGFFIVSDGGIGPYRVHVRRPCFYYYSAIKELIVGGTISDAIATISSLNVIAGELDC